ncbi:hypothetical protein H6G88_10210 [Bifidobacterium ruminantium]|nr:hypothetical protein [Bifidobacterium ruminantium]
MYAQTPQDMARALFEAQFDELKRARAIRKKYRTDVVLGLTSAIRVLLIDMPALYDKVKLLDHLHIVVEEARFRSSLDGVKFHAYTATLPPDLAPQQLNRAAQANQATQIAQPIQAAQPGQADRANQPGETAQSHQASQTGQTSQTSQAGLTAQAAQISRPNQTVQNPDQQNSHTADRADQFPQAQAQAQAQSQAQAQHEQHEQNEQRTKRPKRIRKTPPFAPFEKSKYAPVFVEPHIFTVHPLLLWAQMAPYLKLEELVVLGDAMMRRNYYHVHVSPENFIMLLNELPPTFPHRRKCEKAAKLLAENTDSCMETRLRFRMHSAGYGPFVVNHRLTLNTSDKKTAFLDIAIPDLKIAVEYSGKFHANNWESDEARRTALASAGWQVLSVNAETLRDRGKFKDFLLQLSMTIARQRSILRQDAQRI